MLTRSHHKTKGFLTDLGSNRHVLSTSKIDEFLLTVENISLLVLDVVNEIDCRGRTIALSTSSFFCSPSSPLSSSLSPLELVTVSEEEVNETCGGGG